MRKIKLKADCIVNGVPVKSGDVVNVSPQVASNLINTDRGEEVDGASKAKKPKPAAKSAKPKMEKIVNRDPDPETRDPDNGGK